MNCNIYKKVKDVGLSKKDIAGMAKTGLDFLKKKDSEISVHLVSDKKIKKINKFYRGIDKVTDVLAFALQEGEKMKSADLGDIFISIPQIKRQAKARGISYKEELARILAHGILHLNGFDHISKKEEKRMFSLQEKIVKKIVYGF